MSKDQPAIPANVLIRLAEKADGRRGIAQTIVRLGTEGSAQYDVLTAAEIEARRDAGESVEEVMAIDSARERKGSSDREKETTITIHVPGQQPVKYNAGEVDAVFLTEAAVRKFVLSYYARVLSTAEYTTLINTYYESDEPPFAMIHYPTSQYDVIGPQ